MPIYEYLCRECDFLEEIITTSANSKTKKKCDCGGVMDKVPSSPFLLQESMRKRILGRKMQRMPETLKRQARGEPAIPKVKHDFDEKYEPNW
ncbi:MAG: FmdB family zinc ribbon protein [Planctomycetota bacterium]|jgi:putative FmdB family regulatory protein